MKGAQAQHEAVQRWLVHGSMSDAKVADMLAEQLANVVRERDELCALVVELEARLLTSSGDTTFHAEPGAELQQQLALEMERAHTAEAKLCEAESRELKLKEDADGNKISQVMGIRAACKVMKSRYSKPFEGVQIKIPYESGMDPYSGLLDMFESRGIVAKTGNKLEYVSPVTGEVIKEFRKAWTGDKLQVIIDEWGQNPIASNDEINIGDIDPADLEETNGEMVDES